MGPSDGDCLVGPVWLESKNEKNLRLEGGTLPSLQRKLKKTTTTTEEKLGKLERVTSAWEGENVEKKGRARGDARRREMLAGHHEKKEEDKKMGGEVEGEEGDERGESGGYAHAGKRGGRSHVECGYSITGTGRLGGGREWIGDDRGGEQAHRRRIGAERNGVHAGFFEEKTAEEDTISTAASDGSWASVDSVRYDGL